MDVVKSDDKLLLKSSTKNHLKHLSIEYCVEKREQCSKVECLVVAMSLLMSVYSYLISATVICPKTGFTFLVVLLLTIRLCFKVRTESLLVTAPIGLQLTTTYVTGRQKVLSLPWQSIADVLIVDVIHSQKVLYYLAIKTSQNGLVTLFQKSSPRLHFLEIIYKDVYRLLENNK